MTGPAAGARPGRSLQFSPIRKNAAADAYRLEGEMFPGWSKWFIALGTALILLGLIGAVVERVAGPGWRLPGDLQLGGRGWKVSFPLATSVAVSVALTVALNLALWLARKK